MSLLLKSMGILWLLAEGLIMVYVRKGYRFLTVGDGRQRPFLSFCIAAFILLVLLRLGPVLGLDDLPGAGGRWLNFRYYNRFVWNLYCTLWVVIEGVIAIYIFRIYRLIRDAVPGEAVRKEPVSGWGPTALTLCSLGVFTLYHGHLVRLLSGADPSPAEVYNILRFYIKLCGIFWILFEWYVALAGIRFYRLLKGRRTGGGR